jgi:hypothetical protein
MKNFSGKIGDYDDCVFELMLSLLDCEETDDNQDEVLKVILRKASIDLTQKALNKIMCQKVPDLRLVKYIIKYKGLKMEDEGISFLIGNLNYQVLANENEVLAGNEAICESEQAAKAMYYLVLR